MSVSFKKLVPFLQISKAEKSIDFYCSKLGFTKEWVFQRGKDTPSNICVTRGPIKLYLTEFLESAVGAKYVIWIDGFDGLVDELNGHKLEFELRIDNGDFGRREIRIHDPDKNFLVFAEGNGEDE